MKPDKAHKKQMVLMMITGAFAIFFTGFVHVWSIYQPYVIEITGWTPTQASFSFYLSSCVFVIGNILGGKLQTKWKPRTIAFVGGALFASGVILSAFCLNLDPIFMYLCYGVLQGIGQGMVYGVVLSTAQKWFPGRTGFASGVVITANGLCAFFMAPISRRLLEQGGPQMALFVVGCVIAISWILVTVFMVTPQREWFTENSTESGHTFALKEDSGKQYTSKEMMGTNKFYFMVLAMMCGLIPYYLISPISQTMLLDQGISATTAVGAVMCGSILNAATRLILPSIADHAGRINCVKVILYISLAAMLVLTFAEGYPAVAAVVIMYICFGGIMGNFPSLTSSIFGMEHFGENYGFVMMGMVIASMGTPVLSSLADRLGLGIHMVFGVGAILAFLSIVFLLVLEHEIKKENGKISQEVIKWKSEDMNQRLQ